MKVLLVNGSSRKNGCTDTALKEAAWALNEEGIETETVFIGNEALPDCIACRKCRETGRCGTLCQTCRDSRLYGCNQQIFYDPFHACYLIHLLEPGIRRTAGAGLGR